VLRLGFSAGLIVLGFAVVGAISGYSLGFLISAVLATSLIVVMVIRGGRVSKFSDDLKAALRYSYPVYLAQLAGGFVPILALLGGLNKSELEFLQSNFEEITLVSKPFGIVIRYYSLFY
jgi:hypothetical protein